MAGKSTTSTGKSTTGRKGSSSKGKTSSKSSKNSSAPPKQKSPSKILRPRKNIHPPRQRVAPPAATNPPTGLSLDRKLDITGVILALLGLLTLLSLLSPINGTLTGQWVTLIKKGFGVGIYILPFGLLIGGVWLVLRNFERLPKIEPERVLGSTLLFFLLLATFHLIAMRQTQKTAFDLASQGSGGGYLAAVMVNGLKGLLGNGGMAIALVAVALIAVAVTLDLSVYDIFSWFGGGLSKIKKRSLIAWSSVWKRDSNPSPESALPEFTPLHRPLTESLVPIIDPTSASLLTNGTGQSWMLPVIDQILDAGEETIRDDNLDRQRALLIQETLKSFGAPVNIVEVNRGPTITQFGIEPDFVETRSGRTRVRVSKIVSLADDLALALSARTVRIQAPVPGKGYIGLEVPNESITPVMLRDVLESEPFGKLKSPLRFALGKNVAGQAIATDLAAMPHLLIAGATGSGKSVCVNALICCLLMNNTPDDLRMIMVDPKRVELSGYNGIPHLLAPVVVDLEKVVTVLQWVTREMDMRYRKLSEAGARNIQEFNSRSQPDKKIPFLVVVIDELADLMMLAPDETERTIARLAQMARATGIHLVIATQRPSVEVVTGLIKANFPARIAFAVAQNVDSRVILDQPGAERLLGRGDMLFQAPDSPAPVRLQGVFVSDTEIFRLVTYWQSSVSATQVTSTVSGGAVDALPSNIPLKQLPIWEEAEDADPLLKEAIDISRKQGRASVSMLQRRLRVGYTRASRLVETMEDKGIVGPPEPSTGTREILDYGEAAPPIED